jgi:ferric-dicitrate binding protein FerR (iron transport regulator)
MTEPIDAALTDFFRHELPQPWPAAPALAAPAAARRDPGRRARLTLAASVAALAGACWLLSNGGGPAGGVAKPGAVADVLQNATARHPAATDKGKAKAATTPDPMHGFPPGALPLP